MPGNARLNPAKRLASLVCNPPLKGTELANAYVGTIRLKRFKIGAVILKNTRRIRFLLASGCPYKELYFLAANRLAPG